MLAGMDPAAGPSAPAAPPTPSAGTATIEGDSSSLAACPYLSSVGRAWVASAPSGDHRCEAVAPAAALSTEKQQRLCLTAGHTACATYLAAREARDARLGGQAAPAGWGWVRTTPVVDGSVGAGATLAAFVTERRGWQVVPAIALVAALGALGISNIGAGPGNPSPSRTFPLVAATGSGDVVSPPPNATATAGNLESPVATASPASTVPATTAPTQGSAATPAPTARTTYTVKTGDTLYAIAQQFGVSLSALKTFNGLTSNVIHAGLVLKIP
jgi:LysM repeat protein